MLLGTRADSDGVCQVRMVEVNSSNKFVGHNCGQGLAGQLGSRLTIDNGFESSSDNFASNTRHLPGYMSLVDSPLAVLRCFGEDIRPGGPPGSCGPHWRTTVIA